MPTPLSSEEGTAKVTTTSTPTKTPPAVEMCMGRENGMCYSSNRHAANHKLGNPARFIPQSERMQTKDGSGSLRGGPTSSSE